MTIENCPNCGGTHYGSLKCPFQSAPCIVCNEPTIYACSDCAIDSGGEARVHVCEKPECQKKHEEIHPDSQPQFVSAITAEAKKAQDEAVAATFAEITRKCDAIAERVADLAGANDGERRIIREVSRLTRHGHKTMDLTFRKDGKEYRFEADWVARLFVSHSKVAQPPSSIPASEGREK